MHVWLSCQQVSKHVLFGSKDEVQVGNHWNTCWKKFKAYEQQAKHTGGGDGDDVEPEGGSDSDIEVLTDTTKGVSCSAMDLQNRDLPCSEGLDWWKYLYQGSA